MLRQKGIAVLIGLVQQNEDKVESGQHGSTHFQIFTDCSCFVVVPPNGVGLRACCHVWSLIMGSAPQQSQMYEQRDCTRSPLSQ